MQLLSAQLQYQDPLEPASDVEFIQQLATFASLEQQRITNANLALMQLYESSINNSNALAIVGKEVKILDNAIEHGAEGQAHTVFYGSDSAAAKVKIRVVDERGREVFSSTQIGAEDGEQQFTWHGVDSDGQPVPPGEYKIKITLEDGNGNGYPADIYQMQRVDGISYENGSILVLIDDRKLPIENVIEVYEPTEERQGGFKNASGRATPLHAPNANGPTAFGMPPGFPESAISAAKRFSGPFQVIPGGS